MNGLLQAREVKGFLCLQGMDIPVFQRCALIILLYVGRFRDCQTPWSLLFSFLQVMFTCHSCRIKSL